MSVMPNVVDTVVKSNFNKSSEKQLLNTDTLKYSEEKLKIYIKNIFKCKKFEYERINISLICILKNNLNIYTLYLSCICIMHPQNVF